METALGLNDDDAETESNNSENVDGDLTAAEQDFLDQVIDDTNKLKGSK